MSSRFRPRVRWSWRRWARAAQPGFLGRNFQELVRDREEFAEWIRSGTSARLARKRIVRFFWERQAISMPTYDKQLDEAEIDALWHWVEAVRESV